MTIFDTTSIKSAHGNISWSFLFSRFKINAILHCELEIQI
jgi:hypothetical protein